MEARSKNRSLCQISSDGFFDCYNQFVEKDLKCDWLKRFLCEMRLKLIKLCRTLYITIRNFLVVLPEALQVFVRENLQHVFNHKF